MNQLHPRSSSEHYFFKSDAISTKAGMPKCAKAAMISVYTPMMALPVDFYVEASKSAL